MARDEERADQMGTRRHWGPSGENVLIMVETFVIVSKESLGQRVLLTL